jgi:hypothetical protein
MKLPLILPMNLRRVLLSRVRVDISQAQSFLEFPQAHPQLRVEALT